MSRHILTRYNEIDLLTVVGDTGLSLDEWLDYWQFGNADIWDEDGIPIACHEVILKLCHELCHAAMLIDALLKNADNA